MSDRDYFARRAAEEARLATEATDHRAAAAHWALANEYLSRLRRAQHGRGQ